MKPNESYQTDTFEYSVWKNVSANYIPNKFYKVENFNKQIGDDFIHEIYGESNHVYYNSESLFIIINDSNIQIPIKIGDATFKFEWNNNVGMYEYKKTQEFSITDVELSTDWI